MHPPSVLVFSMPVAVWSPPPVGVFKLNVDASLAVNAGLVGVGIVIRDCHGQVRVASSLKLSASFSPLLAEAVAILHEVRLAFNSGLLTLLVESDAQGDINVLKEGVILRSDLGLVISDIFHVCRSLNILCFSFIPRKGNMVADSLTKSALSSISDCYWFKTYPQLMELLV
ncbi:hypothetical protein ACOSQ2_013456 [Xanthoceras sorbifolium]